MKTVWIAIFAWLSVQSASAGIVETTPIEAVFDAPDATWDLRARATLVRAPTTDAAGYARVEALTLTLRDGDRLVLAVSERDSLEPSGPRLGPKGLDLIAVGITAHFAGLGSLPVDVFAKDGQLQVTASIFLGGSPSGLVGGDTLAVGPLAPTIVPLPASALLAASGLAWLVAWRSLAGRRGRTAASPST